MRRDINNTNHWISDEDKTFIRKADNFDMGDELWIGVADSIDNYVEQCLTDESNKQEEL